MAQLILQLPDSQPSFIKPDEDISETEKFADGGQWFGRMARWITYNFYNPYGVAFYDNIKETDRTRTCDDMVENLAYYYGVQRNKTFNATTEISDGQTIQAIMIPDQKIRQLVDHMTGNVINMIRPIAKGISCVSLSHDTVKLKERLRKQLTTQYELKDLLAEVKGVTFAPNGLSQPFDSYDAIDKYLLKYREKEELDSVKITQSVYYNNRMAKMFEDLAVSQIVNNLSCILIEEQNGEVKATLYPEYNTIFDYRCKDDFGKDATVCGGVQFCTAAEVFAMCPDIANDPDARKVIEMMCRTSSGYSNWSEAYSFYNASWNNLTWWCTQTGKVSVSQVYWIGKKDLPFKKKTNQFGGTRIKKIDPKTQYMASAYGLSPTVKDSKGNLTQNVMGSDINTDYGTWAVHKATVVGNMIITNVGYTSYQVRPADKKSMPELPMKQFCHRLRMGYYRSMVSRLRHYSDEKGRLKLKIQELTGQDMGKVYLLNAAKLGLTENQAQEMFKDFKTMRFSLANISGQAGNKIDDMGLVMSEMDFSLAQSVSQYVALCKEQDFEMESMVNIPAPALGQQTNIIGKGVQQQTINQSSLGNLSVYDGLFEYYRMILQYSLNLAKLLETQSPKEKVIKTSPVESYMLKVSKQFRRQDIGLWIEPDDDIDQNARAIMGQMLQAYGQNPQMGIDPIVNAIRLLQANSYQEALAWLEDYSEEQKKIAAKSQKDSANSSMQHEADMQSANQQFQMDMRKFVEENSNYRAEVAADALVMTNKMSELNDLLQTMIKQNPIPPNGAPQWQDPSAAPQPQQGMPQGQPPMPQGAPPQAMGAPQQQG